MDVDPIASMRCWAIEIELGGRVFEIPALAAADWWPVLMTGDINMILDFIVSTPDDPGNLDDLLLSGALTGEELGEALTDAMEEAAGRSLHAALVIATFAGQHWAEVNGSLAKAGFRWDRQPLGAALDALYAVIVSGLDKDPLAKFLNLLDNELPVAGKRRGRHREKAISEFEAMAGPKPTTGVVASAERSGSGRPRTRPRPRRPRPAGQSAEPRRPRVRRAGSAPPASSASRQGADGPASGTVPPPPPSAR